jgi:hypothetical protein
MMYNRVVRGRFGLHLVQGACRKSRVGRLIIYAYAIFGHANAFGIAALGGDVEGEQQKEGNQNALDNAPMPSRERLCLLVLLCSAMVVYM